MRMLPPFGLWLINLIMSKEFYITSLDNNMNRGTFQGVFAFFFIFLLFLFPFVQPVCDLWDLFFCLQKVAETI